MIRHALCGENPAVPGLCPVPGQVTGCLACLYPWYLDSSGLAPAGTRHSPLRSDTSSGRASSPGTEYSSEFRVSDRPPKHQASHQSQHEWSDALLFLICCQAYKVIIAILFTRVLVWRCSFGWVWVWTLLQSSRRRCALFHGNISYARLWLACALSTSRRLSTST